MDTYQFDLETTIFQLLRDQPGLITLFLHKHMGCVGCCMARFDSIEDAALAHGFQPQHLLAEIRGYINDLKMSPPTD